MAFPMFDTSRLHIKPLAERIHDVDLLQVLIPVDDSPAPMENEKTRAIAQAMVQAKAAGAASLLMYGAHVIRTRLLRLHDRVDEAGPSDPLRHQRGGQHPRF